MFAAGTDACSPPPAMFPTVEQDLVPHDQNRAEGEAGPNPGVGRSLVVPMEGAVGADDTGYPQAFQVAVKVEEEGGHKVAQPAAQGNWNVQPGEEEEEEEEEMISETGPGLIGNLVVPVEGAVGAEGTSYPRASQEAMEEEEDEEDEEEMMNEIEEEEEDYYYFDLDDDDDEDEEEDQYGPETGSTLGCEIYGKGEKATTNTKKVQKCEGRGSVPLTESTGCKCGGSEEETEETESEEEEEEEEESEDLEEEITMYLDLAEDMENEGLGD